MPPWRSTPHLNAPLGIGALRSRQTRHSCAECNFRRAGSSKGGLNHSIGGTGRVSVHRRQPTRWRLVYPLETIGGYWVNVETAAMTQLIDRTAVTRAAASQDADARIARLYETEIGRLTALGQLLTGDASAGEDLAQDVFIDLLEALRADADYLHGPPWPWLRKAMVHHVAKRFRFGTRELGRLMRFYEEERSVDDTWSETTID